MPGRIDGHFLPFRDNFTGQGVDFGNAVDFISEHFDSYGGFLISGNQFNGIPPDPKMRRGKIDIIATIMNINQ